MRSCEVSQDFNILAFGYCRCLHLSVRVTIRTSTLACLPNNLLPIQARITKFGPAVQNVFVKIPFVLVVHVQGQISLKNPPHFVFVRMINHHWLKLEPPNSNKKYKKPLLRSVLFLDLIDLDLQA